MMVTKISFEIIVKLMTKMIKRGKLSEFYRMTLGILAYEYVSDHSGGSACACWYCIYHSSFAC